MRGASEREAYLPRDDYEEQPLRIVHWSLTFHISHDGSAPKRSRFVVLGRERPRLHSLRKKSGSKLAAISIDGACGEAIENELRTCGVTESVIFLDLDGLGAEMKSLWKSLTST